MPSSYGQLGRARHIGRKAKCHVSLFFARYLQRMVWCLGCAEQAWQLAHTDHAIWEAMTRVAERPASSKRAKSVVVTKCVWPLVPPLVGTLIQTDKLRDTVASNTSTAPGAVNNGGSHYVVCNYRRWSCGRKGRSSGPERACQMFAWVRSTSATEWRGHPDGRGDGRTRQSLLRHPVLSWARAARSTFPNWTMTPNLDSPLFPPARRSFPSARDSVTVGGMTTRAFASVTATVFGLFPRHCGLRAPYPSKPLRPRPRPCFRTWPLKVLHPGDMSHHMETP